MTSREWKPGDVAMVECSDGEWRRAAVSRSLFGTVDAWLFEDGMMRGLDSNTRPLVVIDPEDRAQIKRLTNAMRANGWTGIDEEAPDDMQTALRSLIAPPKPDEPTGLGAVVEVESDRAGLKGLPTRLVRTHATHQPWSGDNQKRDWDEIEGPVTILSEGVA